MSNHITRVPAVIGFTAAMSAPIVWLKAAGILDAAWWLVLLTVPAFVMAGLMVRLALSISRGVVRVRPIDWEGRQ